MKTNIKMMLYVFLLLAGIAMIYYSYNYPCDLGTFGAQITGAVKNMMCMASNFNVAIISMAGFTLFIGSLWGIIASIRDW